MKKLYFLNEEETNRILNLHENATKRQYLSEQPESRFETQYNKELMSKYQNTTPKSTSTPAPKVAPKAASTSTPKAAPKATTTPAPKTTSTTTPKVDPKVAQNKQFAARKQQIITQTQNSTKQIQKLLGLRETGNMDSALLQKINDKLNGKPQETPKVDTNTQTPPKVETVQLPKPAGVAQPQLTTMSPEQITQRLQQKTAGTK